MRFVAVILAILILSSSRTASAQEWTEYASKESGFTVNFPGEPRVSQTTYKSEYGYTLPAQVYTAARGPERYSVTVVDYSGIERMGIARAKGCPPGAEPCMGSMNTGPGYWKMDVGGALVYATWQFLQRNAKVTHLMWNFVDLVEGQQLQLTNNGDQSRTFVFIAMHLDRLYIFEGTVPAGNPEPGLFQQSVGFMDYGGRRVRYQTVYSNRFPPPSLTGGGGTPALNPTGSLPTPR
jgi:hypothetical protein